MRSMSWWVLLAVVSSGCSVSSTESPAAGDAGRGDERADGSSGGSFVSDGAIADSSSASVDAARPSSDAAHPPTDADPFSDGGGPSGCTVVCGGAGGPSGTESCTCTSRCNGYDYAMACDAATAGTTRSCSCTTDGMATGVTTSACTSGTMQVAYSSGCGYPSNTSRDR